MQNDWAEDLPENCPPSAAYPPDNQVYYRLVSKFPPTEVDFFSQRKLFPNRSFKTNECRAMSVSVFSSFRKCSDILKFPVHKGKKIVQVTLTADSGVVRQTGRTEEHYSWWRRRNYLPKCKEIDSSDE